MPDQSSDLYAWWSADEQCIVADLPTLAEWMDRREREGAFLSEVIEDLRAVIEKVEER